MIKKMNPSTGRPFDIPIDEPTWKRVKYNLDKELKETKALTVLSYEKVAIRCDIPSIKDVMIINTQKKYTPYKHLDELRAKIDPYTFRQRKEDCLDLPDKIYEKLEVDLTPEQKKAIKDLRKDLYAKYEGKEISAKTVLSVTGRLQLITGGVFPYRDLEMNEEGELVEGNTKFMYMKDSPKIKALLEDLEGVAEDTQILVWAVFSSELELIYNSLKKAGYSVDLYYGATKKNERDRMEADFKAGKTRILVMQPSMGEFGLNFQCATLHYFYSNSYKADTRLQAEDRSHRIGQTNKVTYKDIHCINSIDQKIWNAICMKEEIINFFRNKSIDEIIDF
jgi:SNF2 family DNA or RNA helicase